MASILTHEIHLVFEQLRAIDRRRSHIIDSVAAHFGRENIAHILGQEKLTKNIFDEDNDLPTLLDERPPEDFIREEAFRSDQYEARTIHILRSRVSKYQQHVDEQILFGSRSAGQECARNFLIKSIAAQKKSRLQLTETVQAIFHMTYNGLPKDKIYILSIRPLSDISVHYRHSPHQNAWASADADIQFMSQVKFEWIKGILDILNPEMKYNRLYSCEEGHPFSLEEYILSA